ncbi:putative tol protein [Drechmeria coniospora]|uniref:Putative tol protein n=1 Tax=Drechmeria coniospora TaxID=98403 RepID=A0A151GW72_DRECN|nr:putative tol protein [Drechmeria coniospora]KYK61320.1 putative tol protein [Drechmeria coniospora]ODA81084.1 hypothetical protein RJ55_04047 [Drechmeria coniospora]
MADTLDPAASEQRRSKNTLRNMMQHLTVEPPEDESSPRGSSFIRRLSFRRSRSRSAHSDASTAPRATTVPRNVDASLCDACASFALDVDHALDEVDLSFTKAVNPGADDGFDKKEYLLLKLHGLWENRWVATCPLCKLFWSVHVAGHGDGHYCLSAFSTRDTNYMIDPVKMFDMGHPATAKAGGLAPAFLAVVPQDDAGHWRVSSQSFRRSGMLLRTVAATQADLPRGRTRPGRLPPEPPVLTVNDLPSGPPRQGMWGREIGRTADMSVARGWLQFCQAHHDTRCRRRPVRAEMPAFRLIDCSKSPPRLVLASLREDYVALSYVLGRGASESWPRVVQDAAAVTRELGFRYLWADLLSMAGAGSWERAEQISRMDEIFEGAVLTVVAAHGDDATHGLPGVGSTPRPPQPRYRFADSDMTLVSSLQDPRVAIEDSTWYTRAWTYQEGFLARRRLIFTEQQMYWECDGMLCPETLVLPLELYHDAEQQRMADFVRPGLFNGVSYADGGWEAWKKLPSKQPDEERPSTLSIFRESDRHVAIYTKRTLGCDADSLDAFAGISARLEGTLGRGRLGNVVGIPLWAPAAAADGASVPRTKDMFAMSTAFWHHVGADKPRRRRQLPSWTWAGWEGAVELHSSITVANADGAGKDRKRLNHHYVTATQLTRNEPLSVRWTYAPAMAVLAPDGSLAYDFGATDGPPPRLGQAPYALRVSDPLVLDSVKARTHEHGWIFNDVSVDVRLSRGRGTDDMSASPAMPSSIREYLENHARGHQMSVLWFVEEALVLLLVIQRTEAGRWERAGRARMAFAQDAKEVTKRFGRLEAMLNHLPLRRLGEDLIIE